MTMSKKRKNLLIWKSHITMTKRNAYINHEMQLQNHPLTFFHKIRSFLSANSILFRSPMAYNTTASLDKLTCTDYVDLGKCQDRFERFSWSKNNSNYLDVKLKVFKKLDNKEFLLIQIPTMGEADFNQLMPLRYQLVNAAKNFAREDNLTPVLTATMSKDMDEQLKLAHKVVDVMDRANRKVCVTLLRYDVDKLDNSYAQVRRFARNKEYEKFQQVVYVNYELEEFFSLIDIMNSLYNKVITNQPICDVFKKIFPSVYSLSLFFYSGQDELEHWRKWNPLSEDKIKIGTLSCCTYNSKNFSRKTHINCC